jgi:FkbM family methyltransferase
MGMNSWWKMVFTRVRQNAANFTRLNIIRPPLVIEHMEVDLVFSRLFNKRQLRIIDIGSHHGEFLNIFEHHNDEHSFNVVCVEPLRENVAILKKNIRKFKRVKATICDVAISDVTGAKTFYLGKSSSLFTCTEEWKHIFPEYFQQTKEVIIQSLTFADLLRRFGIDNSETFDLIKIDTEGHDLQVLRSIFVTKARAFAVMFEFNYNLKDVTESINLLKSKNFREFYIFGRTGIPTTYIGEWISEQHLGDLVNRGIVKTGNIVAF